VTQRRGTHTRSSLVGTLLADLPSGARLPVLAYTVYCTVAGDVLDTDVELVTMPTPFGHARVQPNAQDDRHGERVKKQVAGTVQVRTVPNF
jgi:hypothetical protein